MRASDTPDRSKAALGARPCPKRRTQGLGYGRGSYAPLR